MQLSTSDDLLLVRSLQKWQPSQQIRYSCLRVLAVYEQVLTLVYAADILASSCQVYSFEALCIADMGSAIRGGLSDGLRIEMGGMEGCHGPRLDIELERERSDART